MSHLYTRFINNINTKLINLPYFEGLGTVKYFIKNIELLLDFITRHLNNPRIIWIIAIFDMIWGVKKSHLIKKLIEFIVVRM